MLRLRGGQLTIWDTILPAEVRELSAELAKIDALLDDDRFFKPYMKKFNQRMGRPTVPVDTFHRLMYLRHRHQLSYEALVREVQDSIMWRQFCRIPLDDRVPVFVNLKVDQVASLKFTHPKSLRELVIRLLQGLPLGFPEPV